MSGNQKPEGYDAAVYYTPEADVQNAQLIVSQVGEDTNWKMCVDTTARGRAEVQVDTELPGSCCSVLGVTITVYQQHDAPVANLCMQRVPCLTHWRVDAENSLYTALFSCHPRDN